MGDKKHDKVFHFTVASFSATMGALVFTVPLSAYYFGTLVLIAPLSNLLCLWAASGVFLLGLLAVLAGFLWMPLGMLLAVVPRLLAGYILAAARLLAKIPYHAVYFSNPYLKYWLAFAYLLFLAAYLMKPKARRKYAVAALAAVLTLAVTVRLGAMRYSAGLEAVMLDVGQGQCVLLASGGEYALVDCGSGSSWYDAGEVAAHQLKTMGCTELDYMILSHYDKDHISGVTGLLARMDVAEVLVTEGADDEVVRAAVLETAAAHGAEVRTVTEEITLELGKARLRVFPPVGDGNDNERSLAVLASLGEEDLLLTGDLDRAAERALLAAWDLPDIEYLTAGHHGAKTSTSEELLDALKPETVCISVGSNSYGHPARETLRRLGERGCAVCRTDLHGNIHLSLN